MQYNKFDEKQKFFFHNDVNIKYSETHPMNPHYHNRFEIYLITKGNCTYFIDNKVYELQIGDIILIPNSIIHYTKYSNTVHSRMLINCSEQFIPPSVRTVLPSMLYLYRNPSILGEVRNIFKKIEYEYTHPDNLTEEILTCYTHNLFFLLARNANTCQTVQEKNKTVQQAIDYLKKHFTSDITLSEISQTVSVSPEHFSRMFKKETGFGFNKYLNTLRLQKAEILIKQSKNSITKIAALCGFEDSNYFSKKFKEMYGISPKKLQTISHPKYEK